MMQVRPSPFAALMFMAAVAWVGVFGCEADCGLEKPSSTRPVLSVKPNEPTETDEEMAKPFHPVDDCPKIVESPGARRAQHIGPTPGSQPVSGRPFGPAPHDAIVSVIQNRPDEGGERVHIANGVVLAETGYVATALDLSLPLAASSWRFRTEPQFPPA